MLDSLNIELTNTCPNTRK